MSQFSSLPSQEFVAGQANKATDVQGQADARAGAAMGDIVQTMRQARLDQIAQQRANVQQQMQQQELQNNTLHIQSEIAYQRQLTLEAQQKMQTVAQMQQLGMQDQQKRAITLQNDAAEYDLKKKQREDEGLLTDQEFMDAFKSLAEHPIPDPTGQQQGLGRMVRKPVPGRALVKAEWQPIDQATLTQLSQFHRAPSMFEELGTGSLSLGGGPALPGTNGAAPLGLPAPAAPKTPATTPLDPQFAQSHFSRMTSYAPIGPTPEQKVLSDPGTQQKIQAFLDRQWRKYAAEAGDKADQATFVSDFFAAHDRDLLSLVRYLNAGGQ